MLPPLAHPERVASPSIRGYFFQTVGIARQWVTLNEDEVLLCEGDEDADRFIVSEGVVQDVTEYQFKDLSGTVSARDGVVQESIFNFLRAFKHHSAAPRRIRFVFTTSATRARQQTTSASGQSGHNVALAVDVLKTWQTLPTGGERDSAITTLVESLKLIVVGARPGPPIGGVTAKEHHDYAELGAAIDYLDAETNRWTQFVESVDWRFEEETAHQQMKDLEHALSLDERTRSLPPGTMAERLIVRVLETSAKNEMNLRVLTRSGLDELTRASGDELEAWVEAVKANRVRAWVEEADQRIGRLEATTAGQQAHLDAHSRQLDDHEHRLQHKETASRERVVARSARDARYLAEFSKLSVNSGSADVSVKREVVGPLANAALEGSLVVVGDPGAGKSGVLSALVTELQSQGKDVLALSAEGAHDLGDELVDVVEGWTGQDSAVLVVDALDSLRDDSRAAALRKRLGDIIRARGRWRVVASIRTFDLYQGTAASLLFTGSPPTAFKDGRFASVRHVAVSAFTDDELLQIEAAAPNMFELATKAPEKLRVLLRNPFNLSLAGEVLMGGAHPGDFAGVQSRADLLELYWRRRVGDNASTKDAREAVVREVCDRMIRRRQLRAEKAGLDPNRLYDLLTANVMREPSSGEAAQDDAVVAFSHHILFDFAVAKLWLPADHEALSELLVSDPELLIVARPSLEMALARLWRADSGRRPFWKAVLRMCGDQRLRAVGKIIGPTVAVAESELWSDLEPLGDALGSADSSVVAAADAALGYVVGALLPRPRDGRELAGASAAPWAELAELAAAIDRPMPMNCARRLLVALTEHPQVLTQDQMSATGRAARSLFSVASRVNGRYRVLFPDAIRFVCRAFASDAAATTTCIGSLLNSEVLKQDGYTLMPALAREVTPLFADPALAEEIYLAAFGTTEESRETTNFGGIVFGFSSNRRQDYESGLYSLKEAFPAFLAASIKHATRALVRALESYVEREHAPASGQIVEGTFSVGNGNGTVRTDYSSIWEKNDHVDEIEMLDAWERHVAALASAPGNAMAIESLFALCVLENRLAIVWRRWLKLASQPAVAAVVGPIVMPLLESSHVLSAVDTGHPAGEALREQFPRRNVDERVRIERAILATRSLYEDVEKADRVCSRLLGCTDTTLLATNECRALAQNLQSRGIASANVPPFSRGGWHTRSTEIDSEDWLRRAGVPVDEQPHRSVLDEATSLARVRDAATEAATVGRLLDEAARLAELLEQSADGVHPLVIDYAWGEIGDALNRVVGIEACFSNRAVRERMSRIAALVVESPSPRPTPEGDRQMNELPSWGSPHARGTGAEILAAMAWMDPSASVLEAIERLTTDDVASVRYRAVASLGRLARIAPDMIWRVAERMVGEESIRGVLVALAGTVIGSLSVLDARRAAGLLGCLLNRVVDGPGAKEVRRVAYSVLCDLHVHGDDTQVAPSLIYECMLRPASEDAEELLHRVRNALLFGPLESEKTVASDQRRRAQHIVAGVVEHAITDFEAFRTAHPGEIPKDAIPHVRALVTRLETAAKEIYFASGAFDERRPPDEREARDPRLGARLFDEMEPTLERLISVGMPRVTHSVLETLEYILGVDPKAAFLMAARAVESAKPNGYQFDSLAAGLIVRVCTRFLAEHRELLQEDSAVRDALLNVLDVFVTVGWPEAQEITYGLPDIFR